MSRLIASVSFLLINRDIGGIGLFECRSMISSFIGRSPKLFQEWRERANYLPFLFLIHAHVSRFRKSEYMRVEIRKFQIS